LVEDWEYEGEFYVSCEYVAPDVAPDAGASDAGWETIEPD
jgi:hypothetical protein